jgi:hypothetical protein
VGTFLAECVLLDEILTNNAYFSKWDKDDDTNKAFALWVSPVSFGPVCGVDGLPDDGGM